MTDSGSPDSRSPLNSPLDEAPLPPDGVWDVVVVGAGPAGASAAYAAAAQGRRSGPDGQNAGN